MYLVSEGIVGFMGHKTALVLQIASMKSVLTYFSNQICLTPLVLLSSFNFPSLQLEESTNHLFFCVFSNWRVQPDCLCYHGTFARLKFYLGHQIS